MFLNPTYFFLGLLSAAGSVTDHHSLELSKEVGASLGSSTNTATKASTSSSTTHHVSYQIYVSYDEHVSRLSPSVKSHQVSMQTKAIMVRLLEMNGVKVHPDSVVVDEMHLCDDPKSWFEFWAEEGLVGCKTKKDGCKVKFDMLTDDLVHVYKHGLYAYQFKRSQDGSWSSDSPA
ncbi:hypothetical protein J3R30DRAFT_3410266 [Lentinula aciculospora]|uniref:Uncharacterized protein n=1 Tax=Lentinula aciculospora TaxID=153920 RepID=A0A9W8ZW99_9AGAR|nr:hypothetical protein J3R30DRAFT_3410266 [Lentinula aciculospora]